MPRRRNRPSYFSSQFPFERRGTQSRAAKSLLIVTEGQNTEPIYLEELAKYWNLHPHVTHIEPGCEGIPRNLVDKALAVQRERKKQEQSGKLAFNLNAEFDETWIVFDTEHAARQGQLTSGIDYARHHQIQIAHATPCFEFWLALHYSDRARPMDTCRQACQLLEQVAGLPRGNYSKERGAGRDFLRGLIAKVPEAVTHARHLANRQANDDFPANPSTSVQDLLQSMHEALSEEIQQEFPLTR